MAYREIAMWEVLEVIRGVARGEGRRSIARPGRTASITRLSSRFATAAISTSTSCPTQKLDEVIAGLEAAWERV